MTLTRVFSILAAAVGTVGCAASARAFSFSARQWMSSDYRFEAVRLFAIGEVCISVTLWLLAVT